MKLGLMSRVLYEVIGLMSRVLYEVRVNVRSAI